MTWTINHEGKTFTQIVGFPSYYICKDTAEVLSLQKSKPYIMSPSINDTKSNSTYFMVRMVSDEGKTSKQYIHRLMASTFIIQPSGKIQVNHIDGNKHNNTLSNLEWVSHQENSIHAYATGLCRTVGVSQYTKDGVHIASFKSIIEAQRATGVPNPNISKVMKGIRSTAGGYIWK